MVKQTFLTRPVIVTKTIDERVYKHFEGRNVDLIQRLVTGKENGVKVDHTRLLISPKDLAIAILGRINSKYDTEYLNGVYVDTSTAVIKDSETGRVKFSSGNPLIYTLNTKTELESGKLIITPEQYAQAEGFELTKEQAELFRNYPYSQKILRRKVWEKEFMEGDVQLTKDYITYVEQKTGYKFDKIMGLYTPTNDGLSLLCVDRVDGSDRSDADGDYGLDYDIGRLVGVAAEPHIVAEKTRIPLEQLIQ